MKGLFVGILAGIFAVGLPILYIGISKPKYTRAEVELDLVKVEKEYRQKIVKKVYDKVSERIRRELEKLLEPLPARENNSIVARVSAELSSAGLTDVAREVEKLKIVWVPDPKKVERGRYLYNAMCATCHGREGDSLPITPEGLETDTGQPIWARDFTGKYHREGKVVFKFASAYTGELANEGELKSIIREGLPGTPMPAFPDLTDDDLDAIIEYIKTFNPKWKFARIPPRRYPAVPTDFASQRRVELGRQDFKVFCSSCHGLPEEGRGPIIQPTAWYQFDEKGRIIKKNGAPQFQMVYARDFLREPLRRGRPEQVFLTISEGIAGTTMTPWKHLGEERIWNLVSYIWYLRKEKRTAREGEFEKLAGKGGVADASR